MAAVAEDLVLPPRRFSLLTAIRRNPTITFGAVLLLALIAMAVAGPSFVGDPLKIAPVNRLRPPSERWWFGTDQFGRDLFARTVWGARVSLIVGLSVAAASSLLGLALGLACGYFRRLDGIVMRMMDGLMAIPSILLAIALITLTRPGLVIVIAAIVIPEPAIMSNGDNFSVFVVDKDGKAQIRPIQVGIRLAGKAEVIKGLEAGEMVVVEGIQKLRPGGPVKLAPAEAAAPYAGG